MIKRIINIYGYWKVIVYYNVDYNLFSIIDFSLNRLGCNDREIEVIHYNMKYTGAKAVTISSINKLRSVVLFNNHNSYYDYINSIIHEAEHIKQSMLNAYNVNDYGEPPAYTVGYIATQLLMFLL